jgi:rod shape-determining protein MreD
MLNRILFLFFYALAIAITFPTLFPQLRLMFFAPFLVFVFYHKNKILSLWISLLCGLIVDLLSAQTRLGFYALNYCLTTSILYSQKRNFFEDSLMTLPVMTFFFSFLSTFIQFCLLYIFGQGLLLSWEWVNNDLLWMPFKDALYAGIAFSLPALFFPKLPKRRTILFTPKGKIK